MNFGTLYLFSQMATPLFPEIVPACENLLNMGRSGDGRFATEDNQSAAWLCYTGIALHVMWHFGFGNDLRARSALLALVQTVLLRPELLECPIASGGCAHGLVKALAALLSIPREQRDADIEAAMAVLGERLINYAYDFDKHDAEWLRPGFPRYYRSDLVELCHTLAQTPYQKHPRFDGLLRRLLALQTPEGRWNKMRATPALAEERIHHPSRWLTFEAIHTLTMTYGDTIYAS